MPYCPFCYCVLLLVFRHLDWGDYRCRCWFLHLSLLHGCFVLWFSFLSGLLASGKANVFFQSCRSGYGAKRRGHSLRFLDGLTSEVSLTSLAAGVGVPSSSFCFGKAKVFFWICRPGFGAQERRCSLWFLDPAWFLVKLETSPKVLLGQDMEPRGWGAVCGCWTELKGLAGTGQCLLWGSRTSLACSKAAGTQILQFFNHTQYAYKSCIKVYTLAKVLKPWTDPRRVWDEQQ